LIQTRLSQELIRTILNCNDKLFASVDSIDTLREWMASDPICINLYTCLGNGTMITSPTYNQSPNDYVSRAVAYRALRWYFRLDKLFLPEAEKLLPNLTLGNALRAIAHDARERSSKNGVNDKDVLIVLAIDEIQHGLGNIPASSQFDDDRARERACRFFLRELIGDLMEEMGQLEPFFLVPMVVGLSYSNVNVLINEDSAIPVSNLVPRLLSAQGMWHAVQLMFPRSFAARATCLEDLPRQFRTILAFIGGYPRGFQKWLKSASRYLELESSQEWTDALGKDLARSLTAAIERLPKSVSSQTALLDPLFQNLIFAAMRNQVINRKQPIDRADEELHGITWEQAMDYSGFALITQDAHQRLDAPAIVVAAWLSFVTGPNSAFGTLKSLLYSFTQENWDRFEQQTANYVAYLLAVPEAGTSISLAKLLFPFASQDAMDGSIFSSLQVVVPTHMSYRVSTLKRAFPCSAPGGSPRSPRTTNDTSSNKVNKMIFQDRQVMLNAQRAPFGDSFVVLQVSNQSRTVPVLKRLPFFDSKGRTLNQVIKRTREEIDLVLCFQNKYSKDGQTSLSPIEIEQEWHKNIMAAKDAVDRFDRPFVLTMVVVSNRRGARASSTTRLRAIQQYGNQASPSGMTIAQAVDVDRSPNAKIDDDDDDDDEEDDGFLAEFRALPRPYVVVAGTADGLRDEGYVAVPVNEFFPKPLMSIINAMCTHDWTRIRND